LNKVISLIRKYRKLIELINLKRSVTYTTNAMSTKTNKSFTKRLKVSKNGKITARKTGQNHFNAKESRRSQLAKNRGVGFTISNKDKARFISK